MAQKWGYRIVADQFIAGTNLEDALETVRTLNAKGFSCTVDHLGEFVTEKEVSIQAKEKIIQFMHCINEEQLDCHISLKLTQLGLDISEEFCLHLMKEILDVASKYQIFINIDTEDYAHYHATFRILNELLLDYNYVGTVIQSYYYHAEALMEQLKDVRLRIVKGAYKESAEVAYQQKDEIDAQFLHLSKKRLKEETFTSIATHDHHMIHALLQYIEEENIDKNKIEFQMLYGFREELQEKLKNEGYRFTVYLPYGEDWFGYFMRRLAERPRNMELIIKNQLYENNKLKKKPILLTASTIGVLAFVWRSFKKK